MSIEFGYIISKSFAITRNDGRKKGGGEMEGFLSRLRKFLETRISSFVKLMMLLIPRYRVKSYTMNGAFRQVGHKIDTVGQKFDAISLAIRLRFDFSWSRF